MHPYAAELDVAIDLGTAAGDVALRRYSESPQARMKDDGTWVTEADAEVERLLRHRIAEAFPHHNVHGEEEGLAAATGGAPQEGEATWYVDPIDGTNNYMAGIPIWGTLVGLRVDGRSVVGVCHLPALGETYWASESAGAYMNEERIAVDDTAALEQATLCLADVDAFRQAGRQRFLDVLTRRCWRSRGFGDCWGHMLVARGALQVMIEPVLRLWDFVALEPIVREAGGRITTLDGGTLEDGGSCLTTNGRLHEEIVSLAANMKP